LPSVTCMRAIGRRAGPAPDALLHWMSWQLVNYVALPVLGLALLAQFWLWSSKHSQLSPSHP
jgi:hypothetical protein